MMWFGGGAEERLNQGVFERGTTSVVFGYIFTQYKCNGPRIGLLLPFLVVVKAAPLAIQFLIILIAKRAEPIGQGTIAQA